MKLKIQIGKNVPPKIIGKGTKVFIVAEMSANHNQVYEKAKKIIMKAKESGADAIKIQTYTPDTLTIKSDKVYFKIKGTPWHNDNLYELYEKAYTPWDWHESIKSYAESLDLIFFSTPFDKTAVDYLERLDVSMYKVASFEIVDIPLLRTIAKTGKPIIMSTGMATLGEIEEAVNAIREEGNENIALLKCTSSYPSLPEDMNLKTISHMSEAFQLPVGLSDHTLGIEIPICAVAMGACIIEKHFTLSRSDNGPDSSFSLEPNEFKKMVDSVRIAEKALGKVNYRNTEKEKDSKVFRRSLFVVKDIKKGEAFTEDNVRSIRPGYGLHTRYFEDIKKKKALQDIRRGTPLSWEMVGN